MHCEVRGGDEGIRTSPHIATTHVHADGAWTNVHDCIHTYIHKAEGSPGSSTV